jgi:hypothetical protein
MAAFLPTGLDRPLRKIISATSVTRWATSSVRLQNSATGTRCATRQRQFQVLEHGQILVDGRRLELAADAKAHDLAAPGSW